MWKLWSHSLMENNPDCVVGDIKDITSGTENNNKYTTATKLYLVYPSTGGSTFHT